MQEQFFPLQVPPGIHKNGTKYQNKGRWVDSHLVRWIEGLSLGPVGGWQQIAGVDLVGFPRGAHAWRGNDGSSWLAAGTTGASATKAYAFSSNTLTDITPASGLSDGLADGSYTGGDYGEGAYGAGLFGTGSGGASLDPADVWHFDNFGDYLVAVMNGDGDLWYWDRNIANDLVQAAGSPTGNIGVVVTPERFIFALGAQGNVRRVKWAVQEGGLLTAADWTITTVNSAGDFDLATRGAIVAGRRLRRQTLIWTDVDVHAATYIGGTFVYAFEQVGDNCGLLGANAVAVVGPAAFWMGNGRFYIYDGSVRPLDCTVLDHVFGDLNRSQKDKIVAVPNTQFGEVTWYYPSASQSGLENDRYVTYSYAFGYWVIGYLGRAAGVDRGVHEYPMLFDSTGALFEHERGQTRGSEVPYIVSAPIELGNGDRVVRVQGLVPDELTLGQLKATFYTALFPTDAEATKGPYTFGSQPVDLRFSARQVRVRFEEAVAGDWRLGMMRLAGIAGGRR